ncbi:MAG: MFS transporter, partial [Bacilli bacterium]
GWRQSVVLICLFATLLFSIPIWSKVIKKIGFTKVWMISFIMLPMGLFLLYFPNNFISGCVVTALIGPSFGGLLLTPDMILAELIDIDKIKYRVSREAALGSVGSFISRISVIIAAIITSLLSFAFGYESGINPGPNPSLTFQVTFGIMLGILGLMGTICAIIYVKVSKKDRMSLSKLKRLECEETTEIDINTIIDETR